MSPSTSLDSAIIFTQTFEVQAQHCDVQNHLNNVVYVQWIQNIASAAYLSRCPQKKDEERNTIWVVRRHEIDYLAPAFEDEVLSAKTWIDRGTVSTVFRRTEFTRVADSKLVCQAMTEWCYFDIQRSRPIRIPHDIKASFVMDFDE